MLTCGPDKGCMWAYDASTLGQEAEWNTDCTDGHRFFFVRVCKCLDTDFRIVHYPLTANRYHAHTPHLPQ